MFLFGWISALLVTTPLVIAHRGASGVLPEHTLEAYIAAIKMGADYIETDLVVTKDGVLVALHDVELSVTTNVADKFADRKTVKLVDGEKLSGWFVEDFTLAEVKTLRARQRMPYRRQDFNDQFQIPSFEEILQLLKKSERKVGIYVETKSPTYFRNLNLPIEEKLLDLLKKYNWDASSPVFIQSFEVSNLKRLHRLTNIPLVQLVGAPLECPFDQPGLSYGRMLTEDGLSRIANYAAGVGPHKSSIFEPTLWGQIYRLWDFRIGNLPLLKSKASPLVSLAHSKGLLVHVWTFRSDREHLLPEDPSGLEELVKYWKAGIDGVFTDFPVDGVESLRLLNRGG